MGGVIHIDGVQYSYTYTSNNVHIENSCNISKKFFGLTLAELYMRYPELNVWHRTPQSLKHEWATHNFLYALGLWKERTKDVDLNWPNKWAWLYNITGALALIFIK